MQTRRNVPISCTAQSLTDVFHYSLVILVFGSISLHPNKFSFSHSIRIQRGIILVVGTLYYPYNIYDFGKRDYSLEKLL